QQTYSSEVHCVEEILKEMTHSWPPPLTAIHTPSTAEPSKFPFPTKDSQNISSAAQNQKQHDTSSKTHSNSQQRTSVMLEDDLQLSDSEDSDSEQRSLLLPHLHLQVLHSRFQNQWHQHIPVVQSQRAPVTQTAPQTRRVRASSDSEENEPLDTPAPEPEPPTTNKWQLDNWLTKVNQPAVLPEGLGSTEPPHRHQDSKGKGNGDSSSSTSQEHSESNDPAPKSSSKTLRVPSEGPHPGKRSCQKSPAQQEPPQRQTVATKQPKKPVKASAQADLQASLQVESEPGLLPYGSKDQNSKDKPKVKTKGRPRAGENKEPKPAVPTPSERKKHKSSPPAPSKALSAPEPTKDNVEDRSPEHFALVPLTQSQGPPSSGRSSRTSGCRQAVVVQEDRRKDKLPLPLRDTKLLSPLRDTPPQNSLMVKITLDLLSRIPQPPGKGRRQKKLEDKQPPTGKKHDSEKRNSDNSSKLAKKRKYSRTSHIKKKKLKLFN
uniref:Uncharacterized protein n=1 Tax=Loxodonta africana TaxID=9785 RepID=G3TFX2_LOXAF